MGFETRIAHLRAVLEEHARLREDEFRAYVEKQLKEDPKLAFYGASIDTRGSSIDVLISESTKVAMEAEEHANKPEFHAFLSAMRVGCNACGQPAKFREEGSNDAFCSEKCRAQRGTRVSSMK